MDIQNKDIQGMPENAENKNRFDEEAASNQRVETLSKDAAEQEMQFGFGTLARASFVLALASLPREERYFVLDILYKVVTHDGESAASPWKTRKYSLFLDAFNERFGSGRNDLAMASPKSTMSQLQGKLNNAVKKNDKGPSAIEATEVVEEPVTPDNALEPAKHELLDYVAIKAEYQAVDIDGPISKIEKFILDVFRRSLGLPGDAKSSKVTKTLMRAYANVVNSQQNLGEQIHALSEVFCQMFPFGNADFQQALLKGDIEPLIRPMYRSLNRREVQIKTYVPFFCWVIDHVFSQDFNRIFNRKPLFDQAPDDQRVDGCLDVLSSEVVALVSDSLTHRQCAEIMNSEIADSKRTLTTLLNVLKDYKDIELNHDSIVQSLNEDISRDNQAEQDHRDLAQEYRDQFANEDAALQSIKRENESIMEPLDREVFNLELPVRTATDQVNHEQDRVNRCENEIQNEQREIELLNTKISDYESKKRQQESAKDSLEREKRTRSGRFKALEHDLANLKSRLGDAEKKSNDAEQSLKTAENEQFILQGMKYNANEDEKYDLERKLKNAENTVKTCETALRAAKNEVNSLQNDARTKEQDLLRLESTIDIEISTATSEINNLERQIEDGIRDRESRERSLRNKENERSKLRSQLSSADAEKKRAENAFNQARSRRDKQKEKCDEAYNKQADKCKFLTNKVNEEQSSADAHFYSAQRSQERLDYVEQAFENRSTLIPQQEQKIEAEKAQLDLYTEARDAEIEELESGKNEFLQLTRRDLDQYFQDAHAFSTELFAELGKSVLGRPFTLDTEAFTGNANLIYTTVFASRLAVLRDLDLKLYQLLQDEDASTYRSNYAFEVLSPITPITIEKALANGDLEKIFDSKVSLQQITANAETNWLVSIANSKNKNTGSLPAKNAGHLRLVFELDLSGDANPRFKALGL